MPIEILPDYVVGQIAAGEVIERPASVVKELLENSLDAGAMSVHIAVNGAGRRLIRISDNGSGIPAAEVETAFRRHATSKLRSIDDLNSLTTLGFRGEALSSIAAVSRLTVTTRHRKESAGTQIRIEGGEVKQRQSVGAPIGTVISAENLFFNTPARLKFLKKENTEKRHIVSLVTRYAMAYPHVRFILEQDGREAFRSSGSGQLADVVVQALGLDTFKHLVEVFAEDTAHDDRPAVRVYGYTSNPELHRSDRSSITLFVNGRWIQDASLTYGVIQAYHTLLVGGRYPIAILMIDLPRDEVDVNVHPTKAEVRFRDPNAVFATVQRAVRQSVISIPQPNGQRVTRLMPAFREGADLQLDMAFDVEEDIQVKLPLRHSGQDTVDPTEIPVGPEAPLKPRTLPLLRVVGQVGARYIVAEGPSGMYLIDQHAAHQRLLYEQYREAVSLKRVAMKQIASPQTIDLPASEARLVEQHLPLLQSLGFVLEVFGPNTFRILAVPEMLSSIEPQDIVLHVGDELKTGSHDLTDRLIQYICRQVAVKAGHILNQDEMQSLVRQLERCESPRFSPDGQATLIHLSREQLAREFERVRS